MLDYQISVLENSYLLCFKYGWKFPIGLLKK